MNHLHKLAKKYTPTSYASPMMPPPGMLIRGENVYTLLQDYTLSEASQKLFIRQLQQPYTPSIRTMIRANGYTRIISPVDKGGRSVLFWVDGRRPTTQLIKSMLIKDGFNRSLSWGPLNGKGSIELVESPTKFEEDAENSQSSSDDIKRKEPIFSRWLIELENENEARRFVRMWHRVPFPFPGLRSSQYEEPEYLIHAEFLW